MAVSCGCAFPVFAKAKTGSVGVDRGPPGRVAWVALLFHHSSPPAPPFNALTQYPCTPNSTQRKPSTASSGGLRGTPLNPRGPGLQPSSSVPSPRGPGVTSQELRGTRRRRTCGSGPGRCPPAPSSRGRLTSGGRGRRLSLGVARPRHPRQPAGACVRWGAASGPRPPPGPRGERELGDPARLRRQVGRAGWGSRRRERPCAPPSPASRGAGAAEPSPPLARTADPGVRPGQQGERPAERTFRLEAAGTCSAVTCRPEFASWLKSLLTRESGHHLERQVPVEFQLRPVLQLYCCKSPTES